MSFFSGMVLEVFSRIWEAAILYHWGHDKRAGLWMDVRVRWLIEGIWDMGVNHLEDSEGRG